MKYLLPGHERADRFALLLKLTKLSSEPTVAALTDHLVKGIDEATACAVNGVASSNFNRALKRMNEIAGTVERIKEIDWEKLKSVK